MLDTSFIGKEYPPFSVEVEKGHIRRFAHAIGDESAVWHDLAAAKNMGYQAIPAPPTFAFTLLMEANQSFLILDEMGIDKRKSMHAEQGFVYHNPILAGDTITGRQKILDMYEKKGGALQFIVTETRMTNQRNQPVCDLRTVIVVRNG